MVPAAVPGSWAVRGALSSELWLGCELPLPAARASGRASLTAARPTGGSPVCLARRCSSAEDASAVQTRAAGACGRCATGLRWPGQPFTPAAGETGLVEVGLVASWSGAAGPGSAECLRAPEQSSENMKDSSVQRSCEPARWVSALASWAGRAGVCGALPPPPGGRAAGGVGAGQWKWSRRSSACSSTATAPLWQEGSGGGGEIPPHQHTQPPALSQPEAWLCFCLSPARSQSWQPPSP